MIFITGDCHGEFKKFSTSKFPEQKELTRDDIVIVCGDFGIWHDIPTERYWFNWLSEKPFTIVFVDGNHENFDRLYSDEFPVVDFHGAKAQKIRDNIFHLIRGNIYEFEGKTFYAFGGAACHDIQDGVLNPADFKTKSELNDLANKWYRQGKMFRIKGISWWERELPTQEEIDTGIKNLKTVNNSVDYIISHCLPLEIEVAVTGVDEPNILTNYFDDVASNVNFKKWFCGHYHVNICVDDKYWVLYEKIIKL